MNIATLAEGHLEHILENPDGFGWVITITPPVGVPKQLVGSSGDVAQLVDLETGLVVSGRLAHVTLRISSLTTAGLAIPEGIMDTASKPWVVEFNDINGSAHKFKVMQSNPDRKLGVVRLVLEVHK